MGLKCGAGVPNGGTGTVFAKQGLHRIHKVHLSILSVVDRTRCTKRCAAASRRPTRARPSGDAVRMCRGGARNRTSQQDCRLECAGCLCLAVGLFCSAHTPDILTLTLAGSSAISTTLARWRALSTRCTAGGRCRPAPRRPAKPM